jgi:hypothetical protein
VNDDLQGDVVEAARRAVVLALLNAGASLPSLRRAVVRGAIRISEGGEVVTLGHERISMTARGGEALRRLLDLAGIRFAIERTALGSRRGPRRARRGLDRARRSL